MNVLRRALEYLVPLAFLVVALEALVAIPARTLNLALDRSDALIYAPGTVLAVIAIVAGRTWRNPLATLANRLVTFIESTSLATWTTWVAILGILLRVWWAFLFPVDPSSDARTYVILAGSLIERGTYETDGTFAYWPPGYPFFLTGWLALIGSTRTAILTANVALFALSLWLFLRLGELFFRPAASRIACLLLACWPSVWMGAGIAQKEQLLIPLLLAILLLFEIGISDLRLSRRVLALAGTGLLLGYATLVQPSLQLLIAVLICRAILAPGTIGHATGAVIVVAIAASLAVGAWTIRNYQVFDRFILVSTNGGSVLYRANNPLATGGYMARGEISLKGLGELEGNAKGFALGKEWIANNPEAFLRLAAWKQILFLGDDSAGAFESLRRGSTNSPAIAFVAAKGVSNAFWLSVWIATATALTASIARKMLHPPALLALMLTFLYLYTLHSVFESSGRYHLPVVGVLALICAYLLTNQRSTSPESGEDGSWAT